MSRGSYIWFVVALVASLTAFIAGRQLRFGDAMSFDYEMTAPAYEAPMSIAGRSRGGFSGFEDGSGVDGEIVSSGRIESVAADSLIIETAGATSTVRIAGSRPFKRIDAVETSVLRPGVTVLLRLAQDEDRVEAVMVVGEP